MSETLKVQETVKTEQTKTVELQKDAPKPAPMALSDEGTLMPANSDELFRLAQGFIQSGLLPKQFDSVSSVVTGMQYARELGLKPLTALRQIAVIHGTPSIWGDLPLSLCYASGKLEAIDEFYVDKDGKRISFEGGNILAEKRAAVCRIKRKGEDWHETSFSIDDANTAGLINRAKPGTPWVCYPSRMLRYRARSQAIKDKFPDCLNGIAIAEYDHHMIPAQETIKVEPETPKTILSLSEKLHGTIEPEEV